MIAFVAVAALLLAAAGLFVLPPLLAGASTRGPRDAGSALSARVLSEQLAELDLELARGTIDDAHYLGARAEIERRALEDAGPVPAASAADASGPRGGGALAAHSRRASIERWLALVVACGVPAVAGGLYAALGSPGALEPSARLEPAPHALTAAQVRERVEQLSRRLRERPDDVEGWKTLARSQSALRDFTAAADSYRRAMAVKSPDAQLLADFADILAMLAGRRLAGEPESLVRQALVLEPSHPKALALAGTAAFERADYAAALGHWERLLGVLPPGSDAARSIQGSVADARRRQAVASTASTASTGSRIGTTTTATPTSAASAARTRAAGGTLSGTVTLSPAIASQARPDDVVFVVARAADGPRAPLAVLRKRVRDLPLEFVLDDSVAMDPARPLSSAARIVVVARVSRSGLAAPQPGDLDGASDPVSPGTRGVSVRITRALP